MHTHNAGFKKVDIGCKALLVRALQRGANTGFTVDEIRRTVLDELGGRINVDKRYTYVSIRKKCFQLRQAGCLVATKPAGSGNKTLSYTFSDAAIEILTDPANAKLSLEEGAAILLQHFQVKDTPRMINGKAPSKYRKNRVGKSAFNKSQTRTETNVSAGEVRCIIRQDENGKPLLEFAGNAEDVGVLAGMLKSGSSAPILSEATDAETPPMDFPTTLSLLITEQAAAMRTTLAKLRQTANEAGKVAGLRYISLALSQWDRVVAGMKYAMAYEHSLTTGAKPCNAEDSDAVALSDEMLANFDNYLRQLEQVAAQLPTANDSDIELPTLHAPSSDGDGFAEVPCSFRAANLVRWRALGRVLPSDLLARVRRRRSKKNPGRLPQ